MNQSLKKLKLLDEDIFFIFQSDEEVDDARLMALIDERERLLQEIVLEFKLVPDFSTSADWQDAITRTKQIVELIQLESRQLGEQLKKYRHGNKSIQRYQQFL